MTSVHATTITAMMRGHRSPDVDAFTDAAVAGELAPADTIVARLLSSNTLIASVSLRRSDPDTLTRLRHWTELLTGMRHMTIFVDGKTPNLVCLSLCAIDNGGSVLVAAEFSRQEDQEEIAVIHAGVRGSQPADLIAQLVDLKESSDG